MTKIKFDSEQEVRDMLLQYGIDYFRHKAGYIAPQAPLDAFGDIPCVWEECRYYVKFYGGRIYTSMSSWCDDDETCYEVHALRGKAALCYECAHKYNTALGRDDLMIMCWLADEYCLMCGKWEDGIPF